MLAFCIPADTFRIPPWSLFVLRWQEASLPSELATQLTNPLLYRQKAEVLSIAPRTSSCLAVISLNEYRRKRSC